MFTDVAIQELIQNGYASTVLFEGLRNQFRKVALDFGFFHSEKQYNRLDEFTHPKGDNSKKVRVYKKDEPKLKLIAGMDDVISWIQYAIDQKSEILLKEKLNECQEFFEALVDSAEIDEHEKEHARERILFGLREIDVQIRPNTERAIERRNAWSPHDGYSSGPKRR